MKIDLTPTWRGLLPALVTLTSADSPEASKTAWDGLYRLADAVDKLNEMDKLNRKPNPIALSTWFRSLSIEGDGVSLVEGQNIINRAHGDSRVWRVTFKDRQ